MIQPLMQFQQGHRLGFPPCFSASTPILTPSGEVLIQDIQVGDAILAFDGFNALNSGVLNGLNQTFAEMGALVASGQKIDAGKTVIANERSEVWQSPLKPFIINDLKGLNEIASSAYALLAMTDSL